MWKLKHIFKAILLLLLLPKITNKHFWTIYIPLFNHLYSNLLSIPIGPLIIYPLSFISNSFIFYLRLNSSSSLTFSLISFVLCSLNWLIRFLVSCYSFIFIILNSLRWNLKYDLFCVHMLMFILTLPASSVSKPNLLTISACPFSSKCYVLISSSNFKTLTEPPKKKEWISVIIEPLGLHVSISN